MAKKVYLCARNFKKEPDMRKGLIITVITTTLLSVTACVNEDDVIKDKSQKVNPDELVLNLDKDYLRSRIVADFENVTTATKAGVVEPTLHEDAPSIPADAQPLKDQPTNWNGGVILYKAGETGTWWNNATNSNVSYSATGKYYVPAGETWSGSISINDAGEGIDIYIAGDVSTDLLWYNGGQKVNIYILPGASYSYALDGGDNKAHVRNATTIKCWGEFNVYKNKDDNSTKYGLRIDQGGAFYMFEGSSDQLYLPDNGQSVDNYNHGNATLEVDGFFYSEIPVYVGGTTYFNGGEATFVSTFQTDGHMWPNNNAHVTFGECATIGRDTWFVGPATIDVNTCLTTTVLNTSDHSSNDIKIILHNSLLKVLEDAYIDNRSNMNHIIGEGNGYSVFNVLGTLYMTAADMQVEDGYRTGEITAIEGLVDLYADNMRCGNAYYKPVDTEWDNHQLEPTKVEFEDHILVEGGTYLPGGPSGCGQFGTEPEIKLKGLIAIMPPTGEHRFSATGLDFNNDLVYLSWHSNPKIENTDKGGYMDVIRIDRYNATENSLFEQSLYSSEFRFNHAKYYDGILYGAATSFKIGAALAKISLDGDGMISSYPDPEVRRVNLSGKSANCVEVVNGKLVTVSGWSEGALQTVPMTAAKPDNTYHEGAYQGKHIYHNSKTHEVIILHDTENGKVDIYNEDGSFSSPVLSFNAGAIEPYDGKNVCISDSDYIYICRGFNGLSVFDKQGNPVAQTYSFYDEAGDLDIQTAISASGVDVDDRYIYVAAGFGVIVYDKNDITGNGVVTLKPVTKSALPYTTPLQNVSSTVGASANYIRKGADGRLYVAYGVYGLRIYDLEFGY